MDDSVGKNKSRINGQDYKSMLTAAYGWLEKHVEKINDLNVFPVPDGDTGTNMSLTLKSAVEGIIDKKQNNIGQIADIAAEHALMGARGKSGVILSQLLRGLARGFNGKETAHAMDVAKAFQYGVVFAYRAVSKPVEGTILTVAREMARGAKKVSKKEQFLEVQFKEAVSSGYEAVERTKEQLPALAEADVVDAGALGLVVIIEGCLVGIKGNIKGLEIVKTENIEKNISNDNHQESLTFPYCTELIVKGSNIRINSLRNELQELGDSLIIAGADNMVKVHIHTNQPGKVFNKCIKRGSLHDIKVDNMLDQHRKNLDFESEMNDSSENTNVNKDNTVNLITVGNGAEIENIFKSMGASVVIKGGPTMNPQVKDFVQAIRSLQGDCIILPNDKNIRLAAEHAAHCINKKVEVVPTKNIPQGIAAAMSFNGSVSLKENLEEMKERISEVKSGEITFAVRNGSYKNINFDKGDIIGILEGEISLAGKKPLKVLYELIEKMVNDENEVITILYGEDINEKQGLKIQEELENKYSDFEVEVLKGEQPLYYFYIMIE
jgi:hypothetical protein